MPSTVNGIGTRYYGRKNLQKSPGVCEGCHQAGELETYESRLWFVVFFVPIIPLGKKQVLDSCPKCRRHRVIPLGEWQKIRDEAIQQSAGQLEEQRDDPETGLQMLHTLAGFRKTEEATKLARLLKTRHPEHADLQYNVGSWLDFTGEKDEAGECFARAFELDPEKQDYKRAYGISLAQAGKVERAHELLAVFEPPSRHYDPGALAFLAQQSQAHGDPQRAVDLLRKVLKATPQWAKEKWIRKLVKECETAIGAEKSMLPRRTVLTSKAFWVVTGLLLAVVGAAGASAVIAANRTLLIVNGSREAMTVAIDDQTIIVGAFDKAKISLGEGTHSWTLTEPKAIAGEGHFTMSTSFATRFSDKPVFVLDPGRVTVVVQEMAFYGAQRVHQDMAHNFHVGEAFIFYPDIDLVLVPFPQAVRVKAGGESRTRLDALLGDPHAAIHFVSDQLPAATSLSFCERHLNLNPSDKKLLGTYSALARQSDQEQRLYEFLLAGGTRVPVEVDWHRRLQGAMQKLNRFEELHQYYDKLVEQYPNDSTVLYLRGRIEPDLALATTCFARSAEQDPTNSWPVYARTFALMSIGEFAAAREFCQKAIELDPTNENFKQTMFQLRMALGELDELERELREEIKKTPIASTFNWQLFHVLAAKGELEDLQTAQNVYALLRKTQLPSDPFQALLSAERFVRYCQGDFEKVLQLSQQVKNPRARGHLIFKSLLDLDRLEELDQASLPGRVTERGYLELFLHLAWLRRGDADRAAEWFEKAMTDFRDGDPETISIATAFAAPAEEHSPEEQLKAEQELAARLKRVSLGAEERMLVSLTAAAQSTGETRRELIDLAEKVNTVPGFPRHFMTRTIRWLRTGESSTSTP
jgi:tetratricopeptide (TPR) repeat protein